MHFFICILTLFLFIFLIVPTSSTGQFRSFWVRIFREDIKVNNKTEKYQPQRILIVIWPLFVLRSLLAVDVVAIDKLFQNSYMLSGKGVAPIELQIAGTHETEHELSFDTK